MAGDTASKNFPEASVERLWQACVQAVGRLGYNVLNSDRESKQLSFNTGRSMSSWGGQDLTATLVANGEGSTLIMGGSLAKTGNPFGGGAQIGAWGEKRRLISKFITTVGDLLPGVAEPEAAVPTPSADDIPTQIAKLAELNQAGFITDEEFSAKKADLLDRM